MPRDRVGREQIPRAVRKPMAGDEGEQPIVLPQAEEDVRLQVPERPDHRRKVRIVRIGVANRAQMGEIKLLHPVQFARSDGPKVHPIVRLEAESPDERGVMQIDQFEADLGLQEGMERAPRLQGVQCVPPDGLPGLRLAVPEVGGDPFPNGVMQRPPVLPHGDERQAAEIAEQLRGHGFAQHLLQQFLVEFEHDRRGFGAAFERRAEDLAHQTAGQHADQGVLLDRLREIGMSVAQDEFARERHGQRHTLRETDQLFDCIRFHNSPDCGVPADVRRFERVHGQIRHEELPAVLLPASQQGPATGREDPDLLRPETGKQLLAHPVRGGAPRFEPVQEHHEAAGALRPFVQGVDDPVQPVCLAGGFPLSGRRRIQDARHLRVAVRVQTASAGQIGGELPEERGFADSSGAVEMEDRPFGRIDVAAHGADQGFPSDEHRPGSMNQQFLDLHLGNSIRIDVGHYTSPVRGRKDGVAKLGKR